MTRIYPLPPIVVGQLWDEILPLIERVQERMPLEVDLTPEEIFERIREDRMQCWMVNGLEAVCMTELRTEPRKHLFVYLVAGDGQERWFPDLMETIEGAAKQAGAEYSECVARPGWGRVARPIGYREQYRILRKEI